MGNILYYIILFLAIKTRFFVSVSSTVKVVNVVHYHISRLVSSGASLTSRGEGASLALVGHPSSDGVTIKMPYGDVFIDQLRTPSFPIGLAKTESGFIVRSVETGLGRMLVVAVISANAYPFLAFPDLTCHLEDTRISVFWLHRYSEVPRCHLLWQMSSQ